ncbi:disease resistance protein Pik-2 isoform X3 [Lolium perenne]|uniref:disease resistance protein Pik-2 isoform X3 n=1 Tax=Lolium perenne TaxID=4522 RepID=UPI0021F5FB87|nr:disease resistance protein Pik-2-like isoform X3 [Lolium perenne]
MEVVTGAIGSLLPKLGNLLKEEYDLQKRVRGEIMFLETELESMEAALLKISQAPIDHPPDSQVKLWARDVRDLSYELEDSIDKFMVRIDGDPNRPQGFKGFIDRCITLLTRANIRHKIGTEVKDIKKRIGEVSKRRDRYKVDNIIAKRIGPTIDSLRLSALYTKATQLIGTDEKSQYIIKKLMGADDESDKQMKIVSIVGFGGLGKTTLANVVYQKLKEKFDCAAFVSVSQNPNMEKIFKNLLGQLGNNNCDGVNDEGRLIEKIRELLETKRYIIVIDDIWDIRVWEIIKRALIENEYGGRIITTTRILDVAKQVGGDYKLRPLSSVDSRKLFNQRTFGVQDRYPPNQRALDISEQILRKCGGVPLAIITIASMLASKKEEEYTHQYWSLVYESMGSGLENSYDALKDMRRILSVSYYDLPAHLKTCLLYLSLYPEDYKIKIKELVWRWVGEGFIHAKQGKSLYEVGEDYFHELINKSLIQPLDIDGGNMAMSCRIHDMVFDLITFLSIEENFQTPIGGQQPVLTPRKIRRVSFHASEHKGIRQPSNMSLSHVRSVIVFNQAFSPLLEISAFPVLRVLDVSGCEQVKNHHCKDIFSLLHLRYLRLQGTSITEIPKEIGNLRFLQVLDISETDLVKQLPSTFSLLTKLVLLDMLNSILCEVPRWMSSLLSLSSLSITLGTLRDEYIQVLGSIPSLNELFIQVEKPMQGRNKRFVIDGASPFPCLRRFTIRSCHTEMDLLFAHGAMENLQKLELQLGPLKTTEFVDFDFGMENLSSLEYVSNGMIYYDEQRQQALDTAVQKALDMNPNKPKMIRPEIEMVLKLDVGSSKDPMRAIKVASGITGMKSATILGTDRNLLLVIGNIDWTDIIQKLRQNVCCTEVLEDMIHFERKPNLSKKLDISQAELVKQVPSTFVQLTELMLLDMLNNIVCEVPTLMSSLSSMSSLSITVGTLRDEYIQVLGSIPSLSELYIQEINYQESQIRNGVIICTRSHGKSPET